MVNDRKGIISAGNWVLDVVKIVDRWPEEGMLANIISENRSGGGAPFNVLCDLAKLDPKLPLYALGLIGQDNYGEFIKSEINKLEINSDYLYTTSELPTSYTDVITVKSTGNRTFFHGRGANAFLDIEHFENIHCNAKIFHLGYLMILDKLDLPDEEYGTRAARLLNGLSKKGFKISIDLVSIDSNLYREIVSPSLKFTNYFIINEIEAERCTGIQIRRDENIVEENLIKAADSLLNMGVKELVAIHFPEGGYAKSKEGQEAFIPSFKIEKEKIEGTVGAGDAFCAGMLYGLHEGKDIVECLKIANASAWFNLHHSTSTGGAVGINEIEKFIDTKN